MPFYGIDKAYVAYGIGIDIDTTFRNNDAALTAGEIQATDKIDARQTISVDYTDPEIEETGEMSASQYPTQHTTGFGIGKMVLPMFLQTGVYFFALLGTCATTGSYTHAISLNASQTAVYLGLHFEKELTALDIRYDFLGFMPDYWRLYCGEDKSRWKARQEFSALFAYTKSGASDLAEPTKLALSLYEWNDLKHASGELSIKYNGTDLHFDIRAFDLTLTRTKPLWGVKDALGLPSEANIAGVGIELLVEGYLTGTNVRTLMATKPEDYVTTYLDCVIKFYKSATREWGITLGNIYLVPDEDILNEVDWYERKTLRFIVWNSTTTVSGSVKDTLDKTYYEND